MAPKGGLLLLRSVSLGDKQLFRVLFIFLKVINRALVLVWCQSVGGTFEATFHELGSRASLVPLRGMQQHGYKIAKTYKSSSRTSLVPIRGRHF